MFLRYKAQMLLLLCIFFSPAASFCHLLDIDLSDIPATIEILQRAEQARERATLIASAEYTIADAHYLACLALFNLTKESRRIKSAILDAQTKFFKILCPNATRHMPHAVQIACNALLETINLAAEIVTSKLRRLKNPSSSPEVEYPEEIISLKPVIQLFQKAIKKAAREKEECAEEKPSLGSGGADSSSRAALPLPKPTLRKEPRAVAYLTLTVYLRICSTSAGQYSDYLLLKTHSDLSRSVYYPALCRGKPATAYDFELRSDEIEFLDLDPKEIINVFSTYVREGFSWSELGEYAGSAHFPLFDAEEIRNAVTTHGTRTRKVAHSIPVPLFPELKTVAPTLAKSTGSRRTGATLLLKPGSSAIIYANSIITL